MSKATFEGFEAPNTTPVPDIVFDKLLAELTGNELKVLLYIIRRTYGFGKSADAISLSQFREGITTKKDEKVLDKGCGIKHNRTILVALASLEKKGYVIANKRQTTIGDADTTIYKLRFKESPQAALSGGVVTSGNHVVTPGNDGSLSQVTTGSYSTSRRVVTSGNPQETVLQDTDKQDTELQERESPPNILDTHTIVSSDTAHAEYPLITFADCLTYLQEQGVAPRGEDAVEVMVQARTLYAHKHPRYSSRALPGLETHPDDQLPSQQNEQLFRNDAQGDDHEPIIDTTSHHLHSPSRNLGTARSQGYPHSAETLQTSDERHTAPERRDVPLEGDDHATVPALPAANPAVPGQRPASRHLPSDSAVSPGARHGRDVDIPVVRDAPDGERQASRAATGSVDGEDPAETLAETPPTSTPAQSLSLPQAEQAASGARARAKKPETPKGPPVEPPADMAWGTKKCLMWFDFWRGGILIGKWKLMQASTCAKGLAEQFDEQTVIQARTDMEADPYYAAKGGCDVCDVANNIHKYLKKRERQHLQLVATIPASKPLPRIATKEELRRIPV